MRVDKGKTKADVNAVKMVASLVKGGIRENKKKTMPVNVALDVLKRNNINIGVKTSRLRELLKDFKIDGERLKNDIHNGRMRSEYPNQVHEVDPSVALIYFAPESNKVKIIEDSEYYKNKDFFNDSKDKKGRQIKRKKMFKICSYRPLFGQYLFKILQRLWRDSRVFIRLSFIRLGKKREKRLRFSRSSRNAYLG